MAEAKAAFDKLMAEGQAARKSGRPRKNPLPPLMAAVPVTPDGNAAAKPAQKSAAKPSSTPNGKKSAAKPARKPPVRKTAAKSAKKSAAKKSARNPVKKAASKHSAKKTPARKPAKHGTRR
ncbi:MAG: hypothetical protein ACRENQ_05245 [Gemmatimonadaceae bacterium]